MRSEWIIVAYTEEKAFQKRATCILCVMRRHEIVHDGWMSKKKFAFSLSFSFPSISRIAVVKKKKGEKLLKSIVSPHLRRANRLISFQYSCCPSTKAYHFSVIFLLYQQQFLHVLFLPHSHSHIAFSSTVLNTFLGFNFSI